MNETKEEIKKDNNVSDEEHCKEKCECQNKDKHKHNKIKEEINSLNQRIKELEEKVVYNQAELINYRKRKDEETANLLKFANQDLILEIIPVLDNFERAISLDDNDLTDELSKFLEGFKMMYVHLVDILKKFGVEEIPALGLPFDPKYHEALMIDNDKEKEDDVVLEVFLKGYKLKDRVIRPTSVKVNKLS